MALRRRPRTWRGSPFTTTSNGPSSRTCIKAPPLNRTVPVLRMSTYGIDRHSDCPKLHNCARSRTEPDAAVRALTPDLLRRGCDQLQLALLLIDGQQVAGQRGGEPALRAGPARLGQASAPDRCGGAGDESQLGLLLIGREQVAAAGGGESALRADRQVLTVHVPGRLIDAALEVIEGFQDRGLGGDQAEHHDAAWRDEPQRLEAAGPLGVVLQQEPVHWHLG